LITDGGDGGDGIEGVRDLKTAVHGRKYIAVILKLLLPKLRNELNPQINRIIAVLGRIQCTATQPTSGLDW
jgi:hypothetical protein